MKSMTVGEFKARFSDVIAEVKAGEEIQVTFGKKKEVVGYFMPKSRSSTSSKRKLGIMEGRAAATFSDDFKMTEEEFLGL